MKKKLIIGFATLSLLAGIAGALSEYRVKEVSAAVFTTSTTESLASLPETKNVAPTISGQKNWEVYQGEKLNVLEGVSAQTQSGQPAKVFASKYSTSEVKQQEVIITARDSDGNLATETIIVNVKPVEIKAEPTPTTIEDTVAPTEEVIEPVYIAPVKEEKTVVQEQVVYQEQPVTPNWQSYTMYLGGISIPYQNAGEGSGQSVIDANRNMIATFGGATVQSPNDGINTHFIGHNPGIFNILFSLGIGSEVVVTDANSVPSTYIVGNIFEVDDYGTNVATNQNYVDYILDPGTEERITLQTCINQDINLVVVAFPA